MLIIFLPQDLQGTLTFISATTQEQGSYICTANSTAGSVQQTVTLTVHGKIKQDNNNIKDNNNIRTFNAQHSRLTSRRSMRDKKEQLTEKQDIIKLCRCRQLT